MADLDGIWATKRKRSKEGERAFPVLVRIVSICSLFTGTERLELSQQVWPRDAGALVLVKEAFGLR
jgi:hypothetical protein